MIKKSLVIFLSLPALYFWAKYAMSGRVVLLLVLVFLMILLGAILKALLVDMKVKPSLIRYKNIDVTFRQSLNGGGILLSYEFVRLVSRKMGRVDHVFEYCAGPGFIGFNLLANGLCDRLTLADVNPEAVKAVKETIRKNNLQDRVRVYCSDGLDSIPESERWDLVVGNPPWYLGPTTKAKVDIKVYDQAGEVHRKFFRDIARFLEPGGKILFVEGGEYTRPASFKGMIEENGLRIKEAVLPLSFWRIFMNSPEYPGMSWCLFIFLRVSLYFREVFFILVDAN